jgi:hypothetical protein
MFAHCFFEPVKGVGLIPKSEVDETDCPRTHISMTRLSKQATQLGACFGSIPRQSVRIAILEACPADDRPGVFLGSSGAMLVEAMRTHGLNLDIKKIEELGISIPPAEESSES